MIIGPLVDELGRASSYDTRARRLFVNQLSGRPGRVEEFPVGCNEPASSSPTGRPANSSPAPKRFRRSLSAPMSLAMLL